MNAAGEAEQKSAGRDTRQRQAILNYLETHGEITEPEMQELLNLKRTRAYMVAKQMCEDGLLVVIGRGKSKRFVPADKMSFGTDRSPNGR